MKEALRMSRQPILLDTASAISSPGSADGVSPYASQDGQMIGQSGPGPAHANLSPRQAKAKGLLTSGTYGHPGSGSSDSRDLQSYLESRLQTQILGSILFQQIWKGKATPSGRRYLAHTASVRRTSGSDVSSWPTARATDGDKGARTEDGALREIQRKGCAQDLNQAALLALANWISPQAADANGSGINQHTRSLCQQSRRETFGTTANGSNAAMEKPGQLNPEHSRWLMGYPAAWGSCGDTAMQSFLRRRQPSLKRW